MKPNHANKLVNTIRREVRTLLHRPLPQDLNDNRFFYTGREHDLKNSTPPIITYPTYVLRKYRRDGFIPNDIPEGVLRGLITVEEARKGRRERQIESFKPTSLPGEKTVWVFNMPDLDPHTGRATSLPIITGKYDMATGERIPLTNTGVATRDFYLDNPEILENEPLVVDMGWASKK